MGAKTSLFPDNESARPAIADNILHLFDLPAVRLKKATTDFKGRLGSGPIKGNWVSTSLSYPLHLVSEAAMTAD